MTYPTYYDVALSFAGEDRPLVREVARELHARDISVFFDEFEQSSLWGRDLYVYLADLFQNRARFCVMFISRHYVEKPWPIHELKAAQAKALESMAEYILPVRIDNSTAPGLLPTVGYVRASDLSARRIGELIAEKCGKNHTPWSQSRTVPLDQLSWKWGDWIPFASEFISQNPMSGDDLTRISELLKLPVPDFLGHGYAAVVTYEEAVGFCRALGGRLPSVEAVEALAKQEPAILQNEAIERGWCSYEWTRSRRHDGEQFVVQTVPSYGNYWGFFDRCVGERGPRGATCAFRVSVLRPPGD